MVKTIKLTADTPQKITFDGTYPFYWIDNKTSGAVYASVGSTPEADTDGTYNIAAGSQMRVSGGVGNNGITLLGDGRVQVIASSIAACPFKSAPVSGGGACIKLDSSSYREITINTDDWTENSDGGYMCTKTLDTVMPYTNFCFDVVLPTDQFAAKLQITAWNYIMADGSITQTASNGNTTAFTFNSFTNKPTVALTVAVQGLS